MGHSTGIAGAMSCKQACAAGKASARDRPPYVKNWGCKKRGFGMNLEAQMSFCVWGEQVEVEMRRDKPVETLGGLALHWYRDHL